MPRLRGFSGMIKSLFLFAFFVRAYNLCFHQSPFQHCGRMIGAAEVVFLLKTNGTKRTRLKRNCE
jgi:hypothetical protein